MRTLVLQHIACEPPGEFEEELVSRGAVIHRVELDEGDPLPAEGRFFDLVVAMGGPMSVNDEAQHPWLRDEKRLIADAVREGVPFWGSCLGVQLLAAALGAPVYPGPKPEVGLLPVELTEDALADPVFAGLPRTLLTLQWHGDTFDLPAGATLLAGSRDYACQAFRWGERAYGVQFHVEVTDGMAEEWSRVPEYAAYADGVLGPGAIDGLLRELTERGPELRAHARAMFGRFVDVAISG